MIYERDVELITRYKAAGLTVRELANCLAMPPGTVAGKINGFSEPLNYQQRKAVLDLIEDTRKHSGDQDGHN